MFIINLNYEKPLEEVDKYLDAHLKYLEEQYSLGNFVASGKKIPRTGGVILSKMNFLTDLKKVLRQDPFHKANLATYEITEFVPSMTAKEFEGLKELT
ncbi:MULTISPECIES: YciI family protein [Malaciobacter]|jgi:uncharacterized protein YciI|uniref:Uncharacterized protein YciI n=2 Tax=Malaciobacter TaxID=2321114 RepID=A0AB36ZWH1_9BACT|nr:MULTISPECIES: YciI family protein [Malaciobacter]PHO08985.1 GTP cyclohydrolase [Malaciobacter canalis]PPK61520.1 uncharacterized protein YciI [Malaciobacter marinus]QEE32759.1 YciI domain-containing protein [Malaciobacter canalis]SKB57585.1 Uncharacterized conserved protein YciI, contains a putative active-site phosphohistidine [Malaciobacter marinus]